MTVRPGLLEATLPTDGLAGSFIDGAWLWPADGRTLVVENPSRRTPLAEVGRGTAVEIDLAVAAARAAHPAWRDLPASARGRLLTRLADRVDEHAEELARLLAAETGNAIRTQSRGEAAGAAGVLRYFGGVAVEQKGETLPFGEGLFSYSTREPLGVVGAIVPWNSPLQLAFGASLLTGSASCRP